MKTSNVQPSGQKAASASRGATNTTRAGSPGIRFIDPTAGTDIIAATVYASGVTGTDGDGSDAYYLAGADWYDVTVYGATGDGTTDDTTAIQNAIDAACTAGGGVIYFPPGVYLIGGALQDTGAFNGQLLLPDVSTADTTVVLHFLGPLPPALQAWGAIPNPNGHAVLKSTLTGASGTASVISGGPLEGLANRNNISVWVENLTCLTPDNPTMTFWNLIATQDGGIKNLRIIGGGSLSQPTNSNAYGIKLPGLDNANYTPVDGLEVLAFYTGVRQGEMTYLNALCAYCIVAVEVPSYSHATTIVSLQQTACTYGIRMTGGTTYMDVGLYDAEHYTSPAWAVTVYDLDDASNYLHGHVRWFGVAIGGVPDHSFTVNGGANVLHEEIGAIPAGSAPSSADYLVGTASGSLSAEIVVGTTPGGELGGTWASPTVDTTHSGTSHADAIATAEAYADALVAAAAGGHAHVVGETHLSDGSTATYYLDQQFEPGSVEAFNTTTLAYLVVTETAPDQATVSAAGISGDQITFSYAATVA